MIVKLNEKDLNLFRIEWISLVTTVYYILVEYQHIRCSSGYAYSERNVNKNTNQKIIQCVRKLISSHICYWLSVYDMQTQVCCCRFINYWCDVHVSLLFLFVQQRPFLPFYSGCCYGGGFMLSANDIAPAYAGIIFGISNTFATLPGIISPYIVGALTEKVSFRYA